MHQNLPDNTHSDIPSATGRNQAITDLKEAVSVGKVSPWQCRQSSEILRKWDEGFISFRDPPQTKQNFSRLCSHKHANTSTSSEARNEKQQTDATTDEDLTAAIALFKGAINPEWGLWLWALKENDWNKLYVVPCVHRISLQPRHLSTLNIFEVETSPHPRQRQIRTKLTFSSFFTPLVSGRRRRRAL